MGYIAVFVVLTPLYVAMKHANKADEALLQAIKALPDKDLLNLANKFFRE